MSPKDASEAIRRLEDERYAAMLAGDNATLERLLDADLRYTHSSGVVDTKKSYIDGVRAKRWEYQSIDRAEEAIVMRGDTALVFNRFRASIKISGAAKQLDNRMLAVWSKAEDDAWRLLAIHSTPAQGG
jgi:ketosteroid isomerase-like protein